jgi:hypothetical protein
MALKYSLKLFDLNVTEYMDRAVGSSFRLGGGLKARAEGPRKFFNLGSLKCHFLDFGEDLTEF